jgi:hypothetical protein
MVIIEVFNIINKFTWHEDQAKNVIIKVQPTCHVRLIRINLMCNLFKIMNYLLNHN